MVMSIENAYNAWADSYDAMLNKTRDLEELVAREMLNKPRYGAILELGCGTGKNTKWLVKKCTSLVAMDFSEAMLNKAKLQISSEKVIFKQQDLLTDWKLSPNSFDLISCSLVLEHIEDLDEIMKKAAQVLNKNGLFYISELHPFKQYSGSKARFDNGKEVQELETFTHHLSDYLTAANKSGLKLMELKESFDEVNSNNVPRLISFLFQK